MPRPTTGGVPMPDEPSVWKGSLLVAVAAALFGTSGLMVNALGDFPFVSLLAYRFGIAVLAFVLLAAFRWRRHAPWSPQRGLMPHYLGLGLMLVTITTLFFTGILQVGTGLATLLLSTAPVWVVLANWAFWDMRPRPRVIAGLLVGLVGVALVLPWQEPSVHLLGIAAALGAGFAHAMWMIISRAAAMRGSWGETQAGMSALVALVIVAPFALTLAPTVPTLTEWPWLAALALGPGALSIVLLGRGLRSVDAAHAGILLYLEPVAAMALGILVFQESFTLLQGAGAVLVVAGMATVSASRRRVRRREAVEVITSLPERPPRKRWRGRRRASRAAASDEGSDGPAAPPE